MQKFLLKILLLLPVPVLVAFTTWLVDPANLKNDDTYETGVAAILASGRNVANLVNYNERRLQRKLVTRLRKAPEVVVLGSSRSMQINAALFPGRTFLNNAVSGASLEDDLAVFDLYRERNLHPKLVILGLDPWVLNRDNKQGRWRELSDQCSAMETALGFPSPAPTTLQKVKDRLRPLARYKEFVSPAYFSQSVFDLIEKGPGNSYWATDRCDTEEPVKFADGSYLYSAKMRKRSVAEINREADAFAQARPMYSLDNFSSLDAGNQKHLEAFVRYLQQQGIAVAFFLPPYHPTVYAAIKANGAYARVLEAETWYRTLAAQYQIPVLGSFDPAPTGLGNGDFYDGMHPSSAGVKKIFTDNKGALAGC